MLRVERFGTYDHIVTIGDATENAFIFNNIITGRTWIGLTDATAVSTLYAFDPMTLLGTAEFGDFSTSPLPPTGQTPAGTIVTQRGEGWAWITGEPLIFQNWLPNEPNNTGGNEDAGIFEPTGGWNNGHAGATIGNEEVFSYVVEYEAATVIPEPSSLVLLAIGCVSILSYSLRRKRKLEKPVS